MQVPANKKPFKMKLSEILEDWLTGVYISSRYPIVGLWRHGERFLATRQTLA